MLCVLLQVYRARLREEGVEVAVKVQRPDMLESVMQDLYIVRQLATALDRVKSVITSQRPYNVALLDKFATANIKELDYVNEARNQNFFKTGLEPRLGGRVYVPKVYDRYTTRKVRGSPIPTDSHVVATRTLVSIRCANRVCSSSCRPREGLRGAKQC